MSDVQQIACPDCKGKGKTMAFVSYAPGHSGPPFRELRCFECDGSGLADARIMEWRNAGNRVRMRRLELKLGMRSCAELFGMQPSHLSAIEWGRFDNAADVASVLAKLDEYDNARKDAT